MCRAEIVSWETILGHTWSRSGLCSQAKCEVRLTIYSASTPVAVSDAVARSAANSSGDNSRNRPRDR
jgi:hypothetical protein